MFSLEIRFVEDLNIFHAALQEDLYVMVLYFLLTSNKDVLVAVAVAVVVVVVLALKEGKIRIDIDTLGQISIVLP